MAPGKSDGTSCQQGWESADCIYIVKGKELKKTNPKTILLGINSIRGSEGLESERLGSEKNEN